MVLTSTGKPKRKAQTKAFTFRASPEFLQDLEKAAQVAGDPGLTEFIRRSVMERAERFGLRIRR